MFCAAEVPRGDQGQDTRALSRPNRPLPPPPHPASRHPPWLHVLLLPHAEAEHQQGAPLPAAGLLKVPPHVGHLPARVRPDHKVDGQLTRALGRGVAVRTEGSGQQVLHPLRHVALVPGALQPSVRVGCAWGGG